MARVAAVVPAAGQGKRMGGDGNKLFLSLRDQPILAYTLRLIQNCSMIDQVVVVAAKDEIAIIRRQIVERYGFTKVTHIIAGGQERQDSVRAGLAVLDDSCEWVVVHDGARPLLLSAQLVEIINSARRLGSVIAAVPVKDTIKQVDAQNRVMHTPPRESLWSVQTPQVFPKKLLVEAHAKALAEGFTGTDDASLVERLGLPVHVVTGSYDNIKITTREDLDTALAIIKRRESYCE